MGRREKRPPTRGIYVDAPGAKGEVSDNVVSGYDEGIVVKNVAAVKAVRNLVIGPPGDRRWFVRHPWWSALIVAVVGGVIAGIILALVGF